MAAIPDLTPLERLRAACRMKPDSDLSGLAEAHNLVKKAIGDLLCEALPTGEVGGGAWLGSLRNAYRAFCDSMDASLDRAREVRLELDERLAALDSKSVELDRLLKAQAEYEADLARTAHEIMGGDE